MRATLFRARVSFAAVALCLALAGGGALARQGPGGVACRPLGPEDTPETPPEVRATPYCSPAVPVTCEMALAYLYQLISRVEDAGDPYVIVVARPGKGEASDRASRVRLKTVEVFLKGRLPGSKVVTAVGERAEGLGRLEFYVGGKLLYVFTYRRNANADCRGLG